MQQNLLLILLFFFVGSACAMEPGDLISHKRNLEQKTASLDNCSINALRESPKGVASVHPPSLALALEAVNSNSHKTPLEKKANIETSSADKKVIESPQEVAPIDVAVIIATFRDMKGKHLDDSILPQILRCAVCFTIVHQKDFKKEMRSQIADKLGWRIGCTDLMLKGRTDMAYTLEKIKIGSLDETIKIMTEMLRAAVKALDMDIKEPQQLARLLVWDRESKKSLEQKRSEMLTARQLMGAYHHLPFITAPLTSLQEEAFAEQPVEMIMLERLKKMHPRYQNS